MNPQIISQPQANQKKESGKIISQIPRQNLQKIKSLVPENNTGLSSRSVYEETCRTQNKKEDHIHSERIAVHHTLTRHNKEQHGEWDGFNGRITEELLKQCRFP